jgi:eukaryotic-like serine/threonine-protein kinase
MPAPANADEFVDLIRKSGVVDDARLNAYLQQLQSGSGIPKDVAKFASAFIRDGLLTNFQAEQFLLGRWKRFTIGKYKVLERLGSGGMGQVFLCEHKLMRRKVAVKVLPTAKAEDSSSLERFYREARAVAALDHPNIVRAYDIDQDDNLHFLVMEYVDGASLQDLIKKFGPMDVTRTCHYIYWTAIGLQHAHEAGLIHRDIKPGNVLIDRQGTVKILDMGLARFFNDDEDLLTKKYDENVLGTADYLAPEQALDSHSVDGRADIYSLGATFYFMLVGNQPFTDGTVAQKLIWHQTRHPRSIRELRPEVPAEIVAIVEKMMAKLPADRFQSPSELAAALMPFVQSPIDPPPEREMPQLSAAAQSVGGGPVSTTFRSQPPRSGPGKQPGSGAPLKGAGSGANGPVRGSGTGVPAVPASAAPVDDVEQTKRRISPVAESLPPANPEQAVWEALASDTTESRQDRTDHRRSNKPKSGKTSAAEPLPLSDIVPKPRKRKPVPLVPALIAGFAVAAGLIFFAVYWFVIRGPHKPVDTSRPVAAAEAPLTVSKKPAAGQFQTVKAALEAATEGQRIVILDPIWDEELAVTRDLQKSRITIEGGENKDVVWTFPAGRQAQKIIQLNNPEGWTIRNLTLAGNGDTMNGLVVTGNVAGLTIENMTFRDLKRAQLKFENCAGTEANRATVQRVRFIGNKSTPPDAGILFSASDADLAKKDSSNRNSWVVVRDCRFEGPFAAVPPLTNPLGAICFQVSADHIQVRENRFFQCPVVINFNCTDRGVVNRVKIENNTFHTVTLAAIRFKGLGILNQKQNIDNQSIDIERNYFFRTAKIIRNDDNAAGLVYRPQTVDNIRSSNSQEGSPSLNSRVKEADLPVDPDNDATFLHYPRGHDLTTAAVGRKPVGAPPAE